MSTLAHRATVLQLISQACSAGARLHRACAVIGLAARTVQRWVDAGKNALNVGDRRTPDQRLHNCPPNKLSDMERLATLAVLNSAEFKDLPPSQIVPRLADQGYKTEICSRKAHPAHEYQRVDRWLREPLAH